jgi:PAS domain S-box-containing protein
MENDLTFSQIVDGLSASIATTTSAGLVELANRQPLDYLGISLEELKYWETSGIVHPGDMPGVTTAWRQSLQRGEPYELELRVRRAGGAYQWVRVRGLPLRDAQGDIVHWCVLLTDIAERKRTQAILDGESRLLEMMHHGAASRTFSTRCAASSTPSSATAPRRSCWSARMERFTTGPVRRCRPDTAPRSTALRSRARQGRVARLLR